MRQRKIDPVEAYDMRQAGAKVKDLAARYKASCERVSEVISIEALRRFKASRANLVTPATHVIFTELADGWHGYWRDYHVGPCADYAATVQALQDALDARLMPREAA